jgi:hypothetical protein
LPKIALLALKRWSPPNEWALRTWSVKLDTDQPFDGSWEKAVRAIAIVIRLSS